MAQPTNYQVDGDDNGPTYNAKLQALIDAFTTDFSGPTAPIATQPNMLWIDTSTSPPTHWRRNTTDSAWDKVGQFSNNIYYGSVTGSSGSTSKLATARSISVSGDATGSTSFDGSANANISLTLANSGVTAGTYGATNVIPRFTIDSKGRITGVTTFAVTYPISSFNGRGGNVSLTSGDVFNVLPSGGSSGQVLKTTGSGLYWAIDDNITAVSINKVVEGNTGAGGVQSVNLTATVSGSTIYLTLIETHPD